MSLLAVLISLALEKMLPPLNGLRNFNWLNHYHLWVRKQFSQRQGIGSLLIIVLLPVAVIASIQYGLNELLSLFSFAFSIVVLVYCLGPDDEHRCASNYLDALERDDTDNTNDAMSAALSSAHANPGDESHDDNVSNRIQRLVDCLLINTHDRILGVLFWFVILGPMGAALYRLTLALAQNKDHLPFAEKTQHDENGTPDYSDTEIAAKQLHHLLSWAPSHLIALSYAVMGSFVHALHAWRNPPAEYITVPAGERYHPANQAFKTDNHDLLLRIGKASLQFDEQPPQDNTAVRATLSLCQRSLVAWVTILALMTLSGFVG
jgi:AmpE protein